MVRSNALLAHLMPTFANSQKSWQVPLAILNPGIGPKEPERVKGYAILQTWIM